MTLVLGLVMGFGFWELHKLKKDKEKDGQQPRD